jgi:hypothetical protein
VGYRCAGQGVTFFGIREHLPIHDRGYFPNGTSIHKIQTLERFLLEQSNNEQGFQVGMPRTPKHKKTKGEERAIKA